MKGDPKLIAYLNDALRNELTAVNQYFLHARLLENWGITKLAKHEYKESIEEMVHADKLIQRIIMLDGLPNLQDLGKLYVGQTIEEVIEGDKKLEAKAIPELKEAVAYAESIRDYVSRDLLVSILRDEEDHLDHLETMQMMIAQQGLQNFIQLQSEAEGGE